MRQQCIDAVEAAIGRKLRVGESQDIEKKIIDEMRLLARHDREKWLQLSTDERRLLAAEQVGISALQEVKRKNMIFAKDVTTQNKRINDLNHDRLTSSDVIDRMIAPYGDMSGITSVDSVSRAIAKEAKGELYDFYAGAKGDLGIFTNKEFVTDVIKQLHKEDTGNIKAKSTAEKLDFVLDKMLRERFNRSGGDIGKLDKYIPTHWEHQKVKDAGEAVWLNDAKENIDRSLLVHEDGKLYSDVEVEEFLRASFKTLESDGINKIEPGRQGVSGGAKITNRHSQSRVLHWKDANAWITMQEKYGAMPFVDLVNMHIDGMSKDIALVETFGSNPRRAMELLQQHAKVNDQANGVKVDDINKKLNRANVMFDALMGRDTVPANQVLNNIGVFYRSLNVASMLGSAVISSIPDIAAMAKLAHMHGISQRKMFGEMLAQLNPKNKEHRKQAVELGLAVDEMIGTIARWGDDGLTDVYSMSSKLARGSSTIASQVMRLALMNAWSAASKRAFSKMLMNKYGELTRSKSWDELHPNDRDLMSKTGLDERTWEVMRLAEPVDDGRGNKLMSAYSIRKIPDAYLEKFGDPLTIKDEVATKFHAHLLDEQGMAVVESGLRERTAMFGRTTGGDGIGFIARGVMQFKSYPVAVLMRHLSRMNAQDGFQGKAAYAIPLFGGMTLLGGLAVQLSEIAMGNDPQTMWDSEDQGKTIDFWGRAVLKGGGLGILGDIFASGADPSGRGITETLVGPMGGDIKSLAGLTVGNLSQWYDGKDTNAGNEFFKLAKSKIPAQNLFYTRAALQRMILNDMQDSIAPGYREKLLRKAEREHGRTQWWGDEVGDVRAPDFERVVQ
ncbi:TPA: hypothetical protein ACVB54_001880 [Acinetobacter baumannii]